MLRPGALLALLGLLFIAGTTLIPLPQQSAAAAATPLWCLVCGEYGGVDVLNNVLLFVPLGLGLRLMGLRGSRVLIVGFFISLGIELLQLSLIPGRDASVSDVLTNSLGAGAGAVAGKHRGTLLHPSAKQAGALMLVAGLIWLVVQAGTALLLQPWAPDEIRGGAWARSVRGRASFDGRVTDAVVSGIPVPAGVQRASDLAARLRGGDIEVRVRLLSGTHAAVWAPVFEVLGPRGSILSLEAVGKDLAFQPPLQSSRLRLRRPAIRLDDALPESAGIPLSIVTRIRGDTLSATWSRRGTAFEALQVLSPSMGWSLITPFRYAIGPETRWITGIWVAGWMTVLAYWAAARRPNPWAAMAGPGLFLVTGLALLPMLLGFSRSGWAEWLAGVIGIGIGYAGHHFAGYLGERCDSLSIKDYY